MKKNILLSFAAIAAVMVSCTPTDDTPTVKGSITAETVEYTVPTAGTEEAALEVKFTSNVEWKAAFESEIDWATIKPKSGAAGDAVVKVTADAYDEPNSSRSAVLVITGGDAEPLKVTLTQNGEFEPYLEVGQSETWLAVGGDEVSISVNTNVKFSVAKDDESADWLTVSQEEASVKISATQNDGLNYRSSTVTVAAEDNADLAATITVFQNGKLSVVWSSTPKDDITGYDPAAGARLAAYGDYILFANGSKIFALDATTGAVAQTIDLPEGMKAQSLCVDAAGNVIFAANAAWAAVDADVPAEILKVYAVASLDAAPELLIEYNAGNIWCTSMCNIRVEGDVHKDALITAYAAASAYWMAWEVKDGKVGDIVYNTTPYTSEVDCGCVAPNGTTLADGLWFIGYGGDYNLKYCSDPSSNTWETAYVTGSSWMENYDCISTVTFDGKKYLATVASCHFNYDAADLIILDVTDPANVTEYLTYGADNLVNRDESYANTDWTGAGTFADVCLVVKDGALYAYFVDAQYGALACVTIQ